MKRLMILIIAAVLWCHGWQLATAQDENQLPTLDEAVALSQATGRPILAMAGQKT